ncbi:hypothetical protein GLYMA_01G075500v4 [Glycine max]|uniref:Uncharacterized protein n=2 Tax=Glycine subgen. Soja TaxID=1462606 RepID=A0A0R0LGH7_SOYBN|nr:hypothetical protein JHK87_000829 [Glycine soja]KAG5068472.1 hypothetical protein JHK85_000849 [Glycine max]KAG5088209.1 hypothetical protein JHK86_000821 [Glycine max]KAH1162075.1 hypothetical protein GYH30_000806 [Glycine max]KRH75284.1 hypothetical protein GLYMA_01G075500v4 [Glycine max]
MASRGEAHPKSNRLDGGGAGVSKPFSLDPLPFPFSFQILYGFLLFFVYASLCCFCAFMIATTHHHRRQ